ERRIRQLESMVNTLSEQVKKLAPPAAGAASGAASGGTAGGGAPTDSGADTDSPARNPGSGDVGSAASNVTPSASGGPAAPGQSLPPNPPPSDRFDQPTPLQNVPGSVKFGPGFEIRTNDDEFFLQFHNLTQFEYRGYAQSGQNPVKDTFSFPRQWFMF